MTQVANFSALLNPLAPSRVLIFRVNPTNYTLGFDQRPLIQDLSAPRGNPNPTVVASTILNPMSNIVSFRYNDLINVYGVVATSGIVALLSPFVEPITPQVKSLYGELAGCSSKDKAWIAYQTMTGTTPTISYSDVSKTPASNLHFAAENVKDKTGLSLVHDTKRLWLIYQNAKGLLIAYNHNDEEHSPLDPETKTFVEGTPIASVFISSKKMETSGVKDFDPKASFGRIIVYWVRMYNTQAVLYRCHTDLTKLAKIGVVDFSTPIPATGDSVGVYKTAQISAVLDEASGCNRVYVTKLGDDGISQLTDTWAADKGESED